MKNNWANGEANRDGHDDNHSDNLGVEGPSHEPGIVAARALRKRNLLAALMLSGEDLMAVLDARCGVIGPKS